MKRFVAVLVLMSLFVSHAALAVDAPPKDRGLLITPLRDYITMSPGGTSTHTIGIANMTSQPMDVTLHTEQFSVADYTYDYKFYAPTEDWVKLGTTQLHLAPGSSKQVPYTVTVPQKGVPGGHYFTIFASANVGDGKQIQAAQVLYITVTGDLIQTSNIKKEEIPSISFGGNIPFSLDVRDTGNTHFFVYASGHLETWWSTGQVPEEAHLLLPRATRTVSSEIASPILPGIYKAVYGYRTEDGQRTERSKFIVYLPFWSIVVFVGLCGLVLLFVKKRNQAAPTKLNT